MAIPGKLTINVGLQNEAAGSDSLYTAFNKTVDNFTNLFACASSFTSFIGNNGISVAYGNSNTSVTITNTGVTSIIPGTNIVTTNYPNGAVEIASAGGNGGGGGTVTSVGIASSTLSVSGTPIISAGNITVNLPTVGSIAGTYTNPTVTLDAYGRVTSASNNTVAGTVTSVGITPGTGIQVVNSPITSSGNITITNTGVTRLTAGSGISVSSSNGNVTISTTGVGTVTSINLTSSTLTVTGGPITTLGSINVEVPNNFSIAGQLLLPSSENLTNGSAANLSVVASYFSTSGAWTATLAAGTSGQIKTFMMAADSGDMVITVTNAGWKSSGTGTITFNDIGDGCTLQYINSKWYCIGQNGVSFA